VATSVFPSSIAELTSTFDSFVQESLPQVARGEAQALDEFFQLGTTPFVIYGFGDLGRRLLAGFSRTGIRPLAIVDRRLAEAKNTIDGIPCLSAEQACERYGKQAVFIVSLFNQSGDRAFTAVRSQLQRLGAKTVVYFMPVFWKHSDLFLPHYCFDRPSKFLEVEKELLRVFRDFSDEASRACFAFHFYQLVAPSPEFTLEATLEHDTYFPPGLVEISAEEAFFDGGAYDGITLRRFLSRCEGRFSSYLGVEPDPSSFAKLQATVEAIRPTVPGDLQVKSCAVGRERGQINFSAAGTISSSADAAGDISVPMISLRELAETFRPTMIKLDIEGYELDALEGAMGYVEQARPKLAICVYHRQNHFWEIPRLISKHLAGYRLYCRRHKEYLDDFVLYALP
jgi:FkbM family methyltransferase